MIAKDLHPEGIGCTMALLTTEHQICRTCGRRSCAAANDHFTAPTDSTQRLAERVNLADLACANPDISDEEWERRVGVYHALKAELDWRRGPFGDSFGNSVTPL